MSVQIVVLFYLCAVMWGIYVDYSSSAVEPRCSVACVFVQGQLFKIYVY